MSTVCSSMESHRSHIKHSSYTERKQSQTMLSNVATTLPKTLSHQANASTSRVTNDTRDPTINRKRRGNNCDVQVVLTKISKLNDQAASCSMEKSVKEHSNAVDEDEIMVIYDSSSNNISKENSNSHSSDAASIQSNTRSNHNKHTDCNMQNVNHSTCLNSDVSDTNNNINDEQSSVGSCKSTFQNIRRDNLSSNENKENLFINASNCNKQSENGMKDGRTRVGSRKYDKTTSNSNSTIAMEQCPIESNQNDTSLSSPPYFVRIGDTVIKMEEELQITDTNEDALWNSTNAFSMPIAFPVAFEQIPQQPNTEFSEEDVVPLRDTEDDTLRYPQLFDGCSMNTSMKQEVKEEVREVEAEAMPKDSGISSYVTDNRDSSFPHPQLFDRFGMKTSIKQEVKEGVIELEAEAVPKDSGISSYDRNNKYSSFPHPQLVFRFGINTSMKQQVKKKIVEVKARAEPKDSGISVCASDNRDGSFPQPQLFDRFGTNTSMQQEVKEEVVEVEPEGVPKGSDISPYVSDNKDSNFPHPQLFDRFGMNTSIKQEIKEEVIEVEAGAESKDSGISAYASDNRDGSFPQPQLFDRFGTNTSIKQEVKEEVIEVEAGADPKDSGISAYASDNRDGSFPHPQLFDRFGMNTSMQQEVKEEVIEVEAEAVPKDSGIPAYASDNKDGSSPHPQLFDRFGMNKSIKQEVKEEVIEMEAEAVPKDSGISAYASDNRDGSFPHPQLFDRFGMNTSMQQEVKEEVIEMEAEAVPKDSGISAYISDKRDGSFPHPQLNTSMQQEVKEEVIEVEAEVVPKDSGISAYASDNKDGSSPHPQLFDRFNMNTSMQQEVKEEVIEVEAEVMPKDSGISAYASDIRDGSVPYPQSFDRFDMNTPMNQDVEEEVSEEEAEAEPEDSGISSSGNDDLVGSLSDSYDEDYWNWMRKLSRSRMLNNDGIRREVKDHVTQEEVGHALNKSADKSPLNMSWRLELEKEMEIEKKKDRPRRHKDKDEDDRTVNEMHSVNTTSMRRMEVAAVNRAISLKESTNDSVISHKKSCKNKTPSSLGFRRQENNNHPTSSTTEPTVTPSKKSLERKVRQTEPHHLPTRRRSSGANSARQDPEKPPKERPSSEEKKELKEKAKIEDQKKDQKKRKAQNELPDCLTPSKKRASPLTKVEKKQLMDDRKKELIEKTKIEEYTRAKDQKKCRAQNELPDCLTPSKKRASPLTKVEKKQLMDDRKKELIEKTKIEEYMRAKDQKKCRAQNELPDCLTPSKKRASPLTKVEKKQLMDDRKKELIEETKIEEYTRAEDQKKCKAQNEKKGLKEKAKIEEYMRVKNRKKCLGQNECAAQKTSPLTQEEKKQLIADRKKKLKEIALKGRRSSEENNQENYQENNQETNQKFRNVEEKPRSVDQPAVANDVLASPRTPDSVKDREAAKEMPSQLESSSPHSVLGRIPRKSHAAKAKMKVSTQDAPEKAVRSQKMKDIESTSKRAEVAKYKSTGPAIVASSILKSPEKDTTKKIDESNVLNRLAGNDSPMVIKNMNDEITNNFLLHIFRWRPIWLEQQQNQLRLDRTAPVVPDDVLHEMLTHYKSYDEYYRAMLPRVLLETWHEITRNFPPVDNCRQATLMCSIIENSIQTKTLSSHLQLTTLRLEVLVTRKDREKKAYPVEGDLVFFEYSSIEQEGQTFIKVFAYVDDDHPTILSDSTHYNKELVNYVERPYALITYTIRTKPLKPGILVNKIARLTRAGKLRPNLQMVQALEYLPKSPLRNLILNPKIEEYCLPTVPIQSEQLFTREKLNEKQLEAVFKVTETIVQNQAKLCFIQGPPGTGKSTVIVNIVSQVLHKRRRYASSKGALKILVCAPTNAAIDEITLRLLQIRSSMKQNQFNIVRIGQTGVTDPVVKNISVTELTKQEMKRTRTSSMNIPLDSVKEKPRVKIHSLMCKMASNYNMCDCEDLLQTTTARLNKKESVRIQQDAETAVLSQADIITCTLSSIYSKQTETFFMANKKGISVCIMDEATQSTEAETLIPLMLGVNTLVLVGDPNQLPATMPSPRGKIEGRDQSIFSRVQKAFEMNPANPIIMLDTQYRMSHDICRWPSKYLYAGNLETGTPPNEEFPFHPYRLFNIYTSENSDNSNTAEAQFVANMMYTMLTQANLDGCECISYGILTPYNNQKPVILAKINEILSLLPDIIRKKIKFEVSTIDGFRGKERDVVMLSCVRSQHIGCLSDRQRLSVALTRAKHSLIICGNIGLFNKDPIWNSLLSDAKSREVYFKVNAQAESWEIKPLVVKRFRC